MNSNIFLLKLFMLNNDDYFLNILIMNFFLFELLSS